MARGQGNPKARSDRLVIEHLDDEIVVYDLESDEAHLLNPTMATVWTRCDGFTSVDELCEQIDAGQLQSDDRRLVVEHALQQLNAVGLLEPIAGPSSDSGVTRRQLLKRIGIAAVALPAITSILAPTAAAAVSSGTQIGQTCSQNSNCASGCCTGTGTKTCVRCDALPPTGCNNSCGTGNPICVPGVRTTGCCNTTSGNCN